ncbi:MAG: glycosyltransferase [Acidimicrobiales bacterium]
MLDLVLPVLDEATALPWVLHRVPPGFRPIVVDNGSTDGSAGVALAAGARVISEPRRGFGAACAAGLAAARSDVVCFMDADGSLDPVELPLVAGPIVRGELDLCLGRRRLYAGAMPRHGRLANRILVASVARRTGTRLADLGPMRAARTESLSGLGIEDRRSGWPLEMVLRAARDGWKLGEVAVSYRPRHGGRSKVTGSLLGTARAVRDMGALLR